jgi:hypothetical protein
MKTCKAAISPEIRPVFRSRESAAQLLTGNFHIALSMTAFLLLSACHATAQRGAYNITSVPASQHASAQNQGQGTGVDQPTSQEPAPIILRPYGIPVPFGDNGQCFTSGASEARAQLLDKSGPQLPFVFSMSAFSVMGFAKGNWPVVIDFLLEQDSLVLVIVAPEGMEPVIYRLDGKKGHWQTRLIIPVEVGNDSRVAQYVIRSLDDKVGQVTPSHLHVHGIAAGFKAVGSIGIDQVTFGPAAIHLAQGEKAHYMFHSISDFKHVEVDFVRIALSNGQVIAARVGGKSVGGISKNDQKDGNWDGKIDGGPKGLKAYPENMQKWLSASGGQYLLQVRAWYGQKDGDWATALSEDFVTVE